MTAADSMSDERDDRAARARRRVRPMVAADVGQVAELTAAVFSRDLSDQLAARRWHERIAHPSATDPDGAFVAELDGRVIGAAEAIVRERLWCLSTFAVRPDIQSMGIGRALLERAMTYGRRATDAGLIVSSNDPRALRLYAGCGFDLHPTFKAEGTVDRRTLPRNQGGVQEDDGSDLESLEALAREIRGASYTRELQFALRQGGRLMRVADRGFAVVAEGALWLLVSRDEEAASALLWNALAASDGPTRVRWITAGQQWAIDLLLQARLELDTYGALCVRGTPGALEPFLPSAPFA